MINCTFETMSVTVCDGSLSEFLSRSGLFSFYKLLQFGLLTPKELICTKHREKQATIQETGYTCWNEATYLLL